jgi:glycosyltransferase involved in cell wall biosynthesis
VSDDLSKDRDLEYPGLARLPGKNYLLFVGDLSRDKGVHILLEAYAGLKGAPPLVLLGRKTKDGPSEFPENVYYLGGWPHEAIMEAWNRSSIGLAPSLWQEPFGIVAIEAMACGKPVIASRIGGLGEIVEDGATGYLFKPGDSGDLRIKIQRLLENPTLREKMGLSARIRVNRYMASTVVAEIEHIYGKLLKRAGSISPVYIQDKNRT